MYQNFGMKIYQKRTEVKNKMIEALMLWMAVANNERIEEEKKDNDQ